jgi:DNA-binding Lrp family transcriptional regulator
MDKTDLRILDALQRDGRLSNQALAEQLGLSTAACWRRVKALEESGVITRYAALADHKALGLNLTTFIHVTLARHVKESTRLFEESIQQRPEVMECFATTGEADFILRVVSRDVEDLNRFLEEVLLGQPQIAQVKSNIALRELKLETALPLPA